MATYAKLPKVITNHALSLQAANQAINNEQAVYDAMAVDHGTVAPPSPMVIPNRTTQLGHHSSARIPRAMIEYEADSPTGSYVLPALTFSDPHISSVQRLGTGLLFFPVKGLTQFYADPIPFVTGTGDVRMPIARSWFGSGSAVPGIYINSYSLSAGDFVLADYNFCFALYGVA